MPFLSTHPNPHLLRKCNTLEADQAGNSQYAAAKAVTTSFDVKGAQTLGFHIIPDQTYGAVTSLYAVASSGLPVTYKVSGPAVFLTGDTLKMTGIGKVTVSAYQAGNASAIAIESTQTFNVIQASQVLTFPAISNHAVGATVKLAATASSGLTVT